MKKLLSVLLMALPMLANASDDCFVAKLDDKILLKEGDCDTRYAPQSSFKIVLSLIGFETGILKDEASPTWVLPEGVDPYHNACKVAHNPRTWMRDSCLWYSNILTSKLKAEQFQEYITKFEYGNMDASAGLTSSWVSSSIKISPNEYISFLEKLVAQKLPLSNNAYKKTKNIMFIQEYSAGWQLYGKTGNGAKLDAKGNKTQLQQGWFVGYIEKDGKQVVFASHVVDQKKQGSFASFRARNQALEKLWNIINDLENYSQSR